MIPNCKQIASFLFLFSLFCFSNVQAQTFNAKDIDGMWERNDGVRIQIQGTAVFAEGSSALIFNVGNSGWPNSVVQYNYKFKNIKHKDKNTWTANNQAFSKDKKTFISSGNALLIMSTDKSEFTCSGLTYYRKSQLH